MQASKFGPKFRKWSRTIHRELSFFFAGVVLIYAVSGFMLNHKRDFNAEYDINRTEFTLENFPPSQTDWNKDFVLSILEPLDEADNYTKHYFPSDSQMKVFLKGGSSLIVNTETGEALYESIRRRPVWSSLNRLHYNPGYWWTAFSDIFAFALVIITLTGLFMVKGAKGFWGRGGIEFLAGIFIPILFLIFT